MASQLSEPERDRLVAKTEGYSGSDMRNLIQEACQGPIRDAVAAATNCAALQHMSEADLRPVMLRDFQVGRAAGLSSAGGCARLVMPRAGHLLSGQHCCVAAAGCWCAGWLGKLLRSTWLSPGFRVPPTRCTKNTMLCLYSTAYQRQLEKEMPLRAMLRKCSLEQG